MKVQDMIKTTKKVVPMIYAYTTPEIHRHDGWTKIGYTEQDVDTRINQQTHTADIEWKKEWQGMAVFDDGSGETFIDKDFHSYLVKNGIEQQTGKNNEWFHVTGPDSHGMFITFKSNHGIVESQQAVIPYELRKEQDAAVSMTVAYKNDHPGKEFLWNAKPRFGKTLSVYDFCKRIGAMKVLIVTNRPAIANSWYSDYEKFLGTESGLRFVSSVDALKNKPLVMSYGEYRHMMTLEDPPGFIEFVSLQDLKGSIYFGGEYNKLEEVAHLKWDVLVIDEAHEGVDTYKTDVAFDHIDRDFTLHLSGTPFKALANDKFPEAAIYNWTYADEQRAKRDWKGDGNPYSTLPRLNLFTYQMSEIVKDELSAGIELDGDTVEYAFDLNEFFSTSATGQFIHESSVDKFLDAMTAQEKYPFSTEELRDELKHTLWLLNRVDSAKALARKLKNHPVFKDYKIVLAAGDGKLDEEKQAKKSYDEVVDAIAKYDKTITLSVGQLTTGITIPEWTAVIMLSNVKSPALYMQAAFRSQNPCLFNLGAEHLRKKDAYVFDFDPARTLTIFEEFANDLSTDTANGAGDMDLRKEHVRDLLNFFPVIGEDDQGRMIELDAEKVLSIPRKIRSQEVVRRGFMSNFLFQNISNVFSAPQEVLDIINAMDAAKEPTPMTTETGKDLSIGSDGEVDLPDEMVIGTATEIFGPKIFDDLPEALKEATEQELQKDPGDDERRQQTELDRLKEVFKVKAVDPIIDTAKTEYGSDMKASERKQIERKLTDKAERLLDKTYGDYQIQKNVLEHQKQEAMSTLQPDGKNSEGKTADEIEAEFQAKHEEAAEDFKKALESTVDDFVKEAATETTRTVETSKKERQKNAIEEAIRDHLRGFSRTIPSFLMAYGEDQEEVTLANFDTIIPDEVFREVTSISLDDFRFLRDGGPYTDEETGEERQFGGNLFDPVVFDDSVKEFLRMKRKLADYFDEGQDEDIFDYVPPQKTNQIFTPKKVVRMMADMLEEENPGCYDEPEKTFIDMYMKSGLYVAEIVKRLFRSDKMKELYPDEGDRLRHIFSEQVYGLAPTEIIYRIATNYILDFSKEVEIPKHNFRQADAMAAVKEGRLQELLETCFPEMKD